MNNEDIALIRRFRPTCPPDDPAVKSRAWARLQREFDSAPARRRSLRIRIGRRLAVAGVVAAGATVVVVATQLVGASPDRTPRSDAKTTIQTLELAATIVEHQTAPSRPGPQQWIYTRKLSAYGLQNGDVVGPKAMLHGNVKVEEWWKFNGKEMASSIQDGKLYRTRILGPGERPRPGHVDPRFNNGAIGGPGIVNHTPNRLYDYVAGLPTDPDALLARIRRDHHDNGKDVTTFGVITMLFRNDQLIPPKTNAALYRALAKIPGVRIVRNATDYAGRHGIGVNFYRGSGPGGQLIVLNPQTYRYMGDAQEATLDFAVVDKPGQRQ